MQKKNRNHNKPKIGNMFVDENIGSPISLWSKIFRTTESVAAYFNFAVYI